MWERKWEKKEGMNLHHILPFDLSFCVISDRVLRCSIVVFVTPLPCRL